MKKQMLNSIIREEDSEEKSDDYTNLLGKNTSNCVCKYTIV
ncbi:hypothetical protein ACFLY6_02235 [Candidatus Dependentiae bacterium]